MKARLTYREDDNFSSMLCHVYRPWLSPSNDAIPADEMALAEAIAAWPALADDVAYGLLHTQERPVRYGYLGQVRWVDGLACAPGTPSNDDVPRDEMLLAEGLANHAISPQGGAFGIVAAIAPKGFGHGVACTYMGVADVEDDAPAGSTYAIQDASFSLDLYAAGAGLAVALEGES